MSTELIMFIVGATVLTLGLFVATKPNISVPTGCFFNLAGTMGFTMVYLAFLGFLFPEIEL